MRYRVCLLKILNDKGLIIMSNILRISLDMLNMKEKIENISPFSFFSESMEISVILVDLESISTCTVD
jgi:hypothetical protein